MVPYSVAIWYSVKNIIFYVIFKDQGKWSWQLRTMLGQRSVHNSQYMHLLVNEYLNLRKEIWMGQEEYVRDIKGEKLYAHFI